MIRFFRLTNEPGGLGLSCTPAGVSLAGVPLLRRTRAGFVPRPAAEIVSLLKAGYGDDTTGLQARLGTIAQALNSGDFAAAMIAAVHTQTPELSPEAALRLISAEQELNKYNYNPNQPRDWHGRWTTDDAAASAGRVVPNEIDQRADQDSLDQQQRLAENRLPTDATAISDVPATDAAEQATSLEQTFEKKYDDLGPVDFAKQVIQFGYWLGGARGNLSSAETERALAEYSFLQDRLSFWLSYEYKPVTAQLNLLSAALSLYQGAINGGIIQVGNLPRSMLDVAGTAAVFTDSPPRFRLSTKSAAEAELPALEEELKENEGLHGIVNNSEVKIVWGKGIKDQGGPFEVYIEKENPDVMLLKPKGTTSATSNATTFDFSNRTTGEAISAKTLNTLSIDNIKDPQNIFKKVQGYIDEAVNYEPQKDTDLDPALIESKSIYLAIPEYTSPIQWRYLLRAVIYGKDNGVSVFITRVRE